MGETRTTDVRFPPGRYGRRRERSGFPRWFTVLGAVVVVVAGFAIAAKLYEQYGRGDLDWQVESFDTAENSVEIVFNVFQPDGVDAVCRVRARSADGAEVGHAEVNVSAEGSQANVVYVLETSARPVTGEVQRCFPARLAPPEPEPTSAVVASGERPLRHTITTHSSAIRPEDANVSTQSNQPTGAWLSPEAHERLVAELNELISQRPAMAAEINARREEGDLRENGGYHAAKDEQGRMESRIRYLEDFLRTARVSEATDSTSVAPGSVVTISFDDDPDDTETFLLGSREISATTDLTVYSPESALGAAILGHSVGDTVTYAAPSGAQMKVTVVKLEPFGG